MSLHWLKYGEPECFLSKNLADLSLANTDTVPTKWVVDCRKVGYGLPALQYLSHYLYRGVLPGKDIIDTSYNSVTFKYKDGQTQTTKTRGLT